MKVLVVGANGQLGKEVETQFQSKYEMLLYPLCQNSCHRTPRKV